MENASKALIIAGAILLSILIIALGMRIYNSASSSASNADLSAQEISAHNSQFETYTGKQKGSQVIALINAIQKNNDEYEDRAISVSFSNTNTRRSGVDNNTNISNVKPIAATMMAQEDSANHTQILSSAVTSYAAQKSTFLGVYNDIRNEVNLNATYRIDPYYNNSLIYGFEIYLNRQ